MTGPGQTPFDEILRQPGAEFLDALVGQVSVVLEESRAVGEERGVVDPGDPLPVVVRLPSSGPGANLVPGLEVGIELVDQDLVERREVDQGCAVFVAAVPQSLIWPARLPSHGPALFGDRNRRRSASLPSLFESPSQVYPPLGPGPDTDPNQSTLPSLASR